MAITRSMNRATRRFVKRYKPQDTAHRHRIDDSQRKTVRVTSYRRRN